MPFSQTIPANSRNPSRQEHAMQPNGAPIRDWRRARAMASVEDVRMLKTKARFEIDETTAQSAQLPGSKWLFVPGGIVAIAAWYLVYRQLASLTDWLAFSLFGLNKSPTLDQRFSFYFLRLQKS